MSMARCWALSSLAIYIIKYFKCFMMVKFAADLPGLGLGQVVLHGKGSCYGFFQNKSGWAFFVTIFLFINQSGGP